MRRHCLLAVVSTIGVAGSLVMAQLILGRAAWRVDFTPGQRYVLSDYARQVLAALDRDVAIAAFLRADDPRNREIADLLRRVSAASERVQYRLIDVNRNPALARQYGVDTYGSVVVESGGRRKDFPHADEQTLMAAIIHVTRPGRRRVYFLAGHGEHSIADRDRQLGYSFAQVALIHELYEVVELRLRDGTEVPADASALVIAGPRRDIPPGVLRQIDAYVRQGGGLLALLNPGDAPNVAALLRRYGVTLSNELVLDRANRLFAGDFLTILIPGHSSRHPVGAALESPPLMSQVQAVATAATELTIAATDVVKTAPESWRTTDLSALRTGVGQFVAGRDARGPVAVGASLLVRGRSGATGRVLVYGDSDFASNFFLDYLGNRDLLLNSVNWLTGEETLLGSRPPAKAPGVNQLFISARQGQRVFWLGTVVQPAVLLCIGLLVVSLRRRYG